VLNRKNVNFEGDVKHNSIQDIDEGREKRNSHFNNGYIMVLIGLNVQSTPINTDVSMVVFAMRLS
jgi:hypothetical protein